MRNLNELRDMVEAADSGIDHLRRDLDKYREQGDKVFAEKTERILSRAFQERDNLVAELEVMENATRTSQSPLQWLHNM